MESSVAPAIKQTVDRGCRVAGEVDDTYPGNGKEGTQEPRSVRIARGLDHEGLCLDLRVLGAPPNPRQRKWGLFQNDVPGRSFGGRALEVTSEPVPRYVVVPRTGDKSFRAQFAKQL